ncbi:hypothetical protein BCR34DRAFT_40807 [Clohesyomyces aquaticus]|uniref:Uncharacterized protein n=1 Tax=Clohesyomyces aquaticus TaxID=1231657 RepID=A0A1Y2A5E9_9PLEO|nr:hypothetical protein BCR34DRAFT_40807 [Clohesyomyces aquaticus]
MDGICDCCYCARRGRCLLALSLYFTSFTSLLVVCRLSVSAVVCMVAVLVTRGCGYSTAMQSTTIFSGGAGVWRYPFSLFYLFSVRCWIKIPQVLGSVGWIGVRWLCVCVCVYIEGVCFGGSSGGGVLPAT